MYVRSLYRWHPHNVEIYFNDSRYGGMRVNKQSDKNKNGIAASYPSPLPTTKYCLAGHHR